MSGSAFSILATLLVALLAVVVVSAPVVLVVPVALLILLALLGAPMLKGLREGRVASSEPTGVPTTTEASYTPQVDPSDRI